MYIFLIISSLILLVIFLYFSYFRENESAAQFKKISLLIFFILVFSIYFQIRTLQNPGELRQYLKPYPNITKVIHVPTPQDAKLMAGGLKLISSVEDENLNSVIKEFESSSIGKQWLFKTHDQPVKILDFYLDEKNRNGWEIAEQSENHLVLQNNKYLLTIFFTQAQAGETSIIYLLQDYKLKE